MRFHPLRKFASSILLLAGFLASPVSAQWQQTSGAANDIGIGANGAVWVIGTNRTPGGFGIWQRAPRGNDWSAIDGGAVRIAVDPSGMPWVVNESGNIFRRTAAGWQQLPGAAKDIGIGANGAVWVIGTNAVPGGFGIWTWTGTTWTAIDGGGVRIAVDPTGAPWVVNNAGGIFRRVGNQWQQTSGAANDIGIGANGTVVVIGTNAVNGGFGIWALNAAGNWDAIPAAPPTSRWVPTACPGWSTRRTASSRVWAARPRPWSAASWSPRPRPEATC
jgi:ribosome biogenesis protein Nip4